MKMWYGVFKNIPHDHVICFVFKKPCLVTGTTFTHTYIVTHKNNSNLSFWLFQCANKIRNGIKSCDKRKTGINWYIRPNPTSWDSSCITKDRSVLIPTTLWAITPYHTTPWRLLLHYSQNTMDIHCLRLWIKITNMRIMSAHYLKLVKLKLSFYCMVV